MKDTDDFGKSRATALAEPEVAEPPRYGEYGEPDDFSVDNGRRTRRVLQGALAGLIAVVLLGFFVYKREKASQAADAAAVAPAAAVQPVSTATVAAVSRDLPVFIEATGSFTAFESTDVAPEAAGQVVSTPVDVGTFVHRNQVLARLDDRDAVLRVRQAEAAVAQAQANVRQAREKIGGAANGGLDPTRVAEVEAARANAELAETNERRYRILLESGDVARAQYDEIRARAVTSRRQYEAALAAARSSGAGVDVASSGVEAARAQLAIAKKAVSDTVITAPLDGYVGERPAAVGEWVTPQNKIATVVQTGALKLLLTISESDAGRIRNGMAVSLHVDSFPGREFNGMVGAISPSLDPGSRSLIAIVGVLNPQNELRPGMFATARIVEPSMGRKGIVVPVEAIAQSSAGTSRVFVIRDNRAEARVIQAGQTDNGYVQIITGVQEGEEVAVSNVDKLQDGSPIVK